MSRESRQERLVRAQARLYGITIKDGVVSKRGQGEGPLAGAHARVETAGDLDKRVTATRFVLTGPLAFALRKKKDHRQLFITIDGEGYQIFAGVSGADEKSQRRAREFAADFTTVAARTMRGAEGERQDDEIDEQQLATAPAAEEDDEQQSATALAADPVVQLAQLAELHRTGALTGEEFIQAKVRILGG